MIEKEKNQIAKSKHSLLLKLAGYGDADMINIYRNGNFIEPIAATKPAPGFLLTSNAKKLNCTHAMHFSSFHKYVRKDSLWANKYTTPENDLERGWDKNIGYFKIMINPLVNWVWIGGILMVIGSLFAFWPSRRVA